MKFDKTPEWFFVRLRSVSTYKFSLGFLIKCGKDGKVGRNYFLSNSFYFQPLSVRRGGNRLGSRMAVSNMKPGSEAAIVEGDVGQFEMKQQEMDRNNNKQDK